jgi:hypothetical protein
MLRCSEANCRVLCILSDKDNCPCLQRYGQRPESSSTRTVSLYRRLPQIPVSSSTSATKVDGEATAIETKAKMQDQPASNLEIGSIEDLLTTKIDDAILHAQGHEAAMPRPPPSSPPWASASASLTLGWAISATSARISSMAVPQERHLRPRCRSCLPVDR